MMQQHRQDVKMEKPHPRLMSVASRSATWGVPDRSLSIASFQRAASAHRPAPVMRPKHERTMTRPTTQCLCLSLKPAAVSQAIDRGSGSHRGWASAGRMAKPWRLEPGSFFHITCHCPEERSKATSHHQELK